MKKIARAIKPLKVQKVVLKTDVLKIAAAAAALNHVAVKIGQSKNRKTLIY